MAQDPHAATVQSLYKWLVAESPTLQKKMKSGQKLSPDLQMRAYPNGLTYDITLSFFIEETVSVPLSVLPQHLIEAIAKMAESRDRARTFTTIKPAVHGSSAVVFSDCVWNDFVVL